jgi:AbrB family looped-hinge helix DNA binding protein
MVVRVKNRGGKISSKHQITIPKRVMDATGLAAGDRIVAVANGAGQVVLRRVEDPIEKYSGALTGKLDRRLIDALRKEWD